MNVAVGYHLADFIKNSPLMEIEYDKMLNPIEAMDNVVGGINPGTMGAGFKYQVFDMVIGSDTVPVVNLLCPEQRPTEMLLHHIAMLKHN